MLPCFVHPQGKGCWYLTLTVGSCPAEPRGLSLSFPMGLEMPVPHGIGAGVLVPGVNGGVGRSWMCLIPHQHPRVMMKLPLLSLSSASFHAAVHSCPKITPGGPWGWPRLGCALIPFRCWVLLCFKSNFTMWKGKFSHQVFPGTLCGIPCLGAVKAVRSRKSSFQVRDGDCCLHPCLPRGGFAQGRLV